MVRSKTRGRKMRMQKQKTRKQRGGAYQCGKIMCEDTEVCGKDSIGQDKCSTRNNSSKAGKTSANRRNGAPGAPSKRH
jgi:hypothetical protein